MSLVGWAVLVVVVIAVAVLALWPYLDRRSGDRTGTIADDAAEAAARSRRLTIILFTAAIIGLVGIGLRIASERALDAREDDLRRALTDAGPQRLEEVRLLLRDPNGTVDAARELDGLTADARIGVRGITPSGDEPTVAFAEVDWLWAARCYLLVIDPGGEHTLTRDDC